MMYENVDLTEEELERLVTEAKARGNPDDKIEPRAVRIWYDPRSRLVMFELRNGCVFGFPPGLDPWWGLANATDEELARGKVIGGGEGLGWDELDAHISVPGVMFELLNVRGSYAKWLGSATSEAKAAAARENGKKGGRPRTRPAPAPDAPKTGTRSRTTAPAARRTGRGGRATSGD